MKAAILSEPGLDNLKVRDVAPLEPQPGEVIVRMHSASLNYRDTLIVEGGYGRQQKRAELVPLSDGAGTVLSCGEGVTDVAPGDRVVTSFFTTWLDGPPLHGAFDGNLGGTVDGVAAEEVRLPASTLVRLPDEVSLEQAATFPCAGVTAWNAIESADGIGPGSWVVVQGTGGVSLFALQIAKGLGAKVIATTSTPEKMDYLRQLGADHVINYAETPEWSREAREVTGGNGADLVVEVGGAQTLNQSLRSVRIGGTVAAIGVLAGHEAPLNLAHLVTRQVRLQGITVGSKRQLADLVAFAAKGHIKARIDRTYPLADVATAIREFSNASHIGKVVIRIGED